MNDSSKFAAAIARIEEANSADPNRETYQGCEESKEVVYAHRMTDWLNRLDASASEALRLAIHGQHICRWTIARSSYPMDRIGYLKWRSDCKKMHAEKLGQILSEVGYGASTIERVQSLVRKEGLKTDPETQLLEDVACLVFLENYLADFAQQHDEAKILEIVRKTWKKMSPLGHEAALQLPLSTAAQKLIERALNNDP